MVKSIVHRLRIIHCTYYVLILSQSVCGYSTQARAGRKRKRKNEQQNANADSGCGNASRRAAYDYTGCLAHADVTYKYSDDGTTLICRLVGYLEHNESCRAAKLVRIPAVPLHTHVAEVAVHQLGNGAGYVLSLSLLSHLRYILVPY